MKTETAQHCKCEIRPNYAPSKITNVLEYLGGEIVYCPLHAAAPEMLQALKSAVDYLPEGDGQYVSHLRSIIAKAEAQ